MSANNWTICPKCKAKGDRAKMDAIAKAKAQYGKITPEAYEEIIAAANNRAAQLPREVMREDYCIGIRDGEFHVGYSAFCTDCGFRFVFNHNKEANP